MFPHLRTLVQELFASEKCVQEFLAGPDEFLEEIPLSAEERVALLRLSGRLKTAVETGALLVSPTGLWP